MSAISVWHGPEAVVRRCSVKIVFLEIPQRFTGKQEKETLAQVFSCEFCEISMNTFSYRTPPVVASDGPDCASGSTQQGMFKRLAIP